jgi:iron complex transport system permease protein
MEFEFTRVLIAFIVGYFLSVSGSLTQLITNNSLASPSTLGMDGLAVLFIIGSYFLSLFIQVDISSESLSFILFNVFIIIFIIIKLLLKSKKILIIENIWSHSGMKSIILIGLAFNLLIGAFFSIVQFLFVAMNIKFPTAIWFGNLRQYDPSWLYLFLIFFVLTFLIIWRISRKLDILNVGTLFAQGLNINIEKIQMICLTLSLVLSGLVISYFGVFSFLGLIFPHILRSISIFRNNMRRELIIGPLFTGVIFSGIDFICYTYTYQGAELPVGMVSSVIGSFFLIYLLIRSKISFS